MAQSQEAQERLLGVRREIANSSLHKAAIRVAVQQVQSLSSISDPTEFALEVIGTQIADERVPSSCSFHPSGQVLATGGWSGVISTWAMPLAQKLDTLKGHTDRVTSISYSESGNLISSSADKTVKVWRGHQCFTLVGHTDRVNSALFHPVESLAVSASHDQTVRLWDVNRGEEILVQDGHAKPVYALALHPDGSLLVSGDLGGVGLLWDLRTGKSILHLRGHLKQLLALSISPNGYTVVSGSDDNTVRLWDLRRHGLVYTIPAHEKLISTVLCTSTHIFSGSYDHTLKVWSCKDNSLVLTVPHANKVTHVSVSPDSKMVVTCAFDKTIKLMNVRTDSFSRT